MTQVQHWRRALVRDENPQVERATLSRAAEAFHKNSDHQNIAIGRLKYQQALAVQQLAAVKGEQALCQGQEPALTILNGDSLAQLTLDFPLAGCAPYVSETAHRLDQVAQSYTQDLSSPISIPSPNSISSQDSFSQSTSEPWQIIHSCDSSPTLRACALHQNPVLQTNMPYGNMVDSRIPSTPQSIEDDVSTQQLMAYGTRYPYQDDSFHQESGHTTAYGSPASQPHQPDHYDEISEIYQSGREAMVPRVDWYGTPGRQYGPQYSGINHQLPRYAHRIQEVPSHSDRSNGMVSVHRSRVANSRPRGTPDPPPKPRKTKSKATKSKAPPINQPLSKLTENSKKPVKAMEKWVKRPFEDRRKEAEDKNGYVPRPMNSFMLYRSAYAERTKEWCAQNNHQVVSSVCGASWPLEPDNIREFYNNLARVEREEHQACFPDYKFAPSKTNTATRKRKGKDAESDDEYGVGAQDGSDLEWTPPGSSRKGSRSRQRARRAEMEVHDPAQYPGLSPYYPAVGPPVNRSAFHQSNSARPLPRHIEELEAYTQRSGHYYTQNMGPSHNGMGEDVQIQPVSTPSVPIHPPSGMPGANHDELVYGVSSLVDPALVNFDQNYGVGNFTEQGFEELEGEILAQHGQQLHLRRRSIPDESQQARLQSQTEQEAWGYELTEDDFQLLVDHNQNVSG